MNARRGSVHEVTITDTQATLAADPTAQLIDVREDREFATGHAAGASHLARGVLERDIEQRVPDPATPLYLYCGGGYRSILAADTLQQMGYTNVHSVIGGWRGWQDAGAPVERPMPSSAADGTP